MTPRPVLFVDHAAALGGAERSLLLLMTFLDRSRWRPHLIAPGGRLAEEAARSGIPVHTLELPRLRGSSCSLARWWHGAVSISKIAKETGAALIHSNTVRATAYAGLAARLASLPFIWHMRDFWLSEAEPSSKLTDRTGKTHFLQHSDRRAYQFTRSRQAPAMLRQTVRPPQRHRPFPLRPEPNCG